MSSSRILKKVLLLIIIVAAIVAYKAYDIYAMAFKSNVQLGDKEKIDFYIYSNSNFDDVYSKLRQKKILKDTASFKWVAEKKNYFNHIYAGRYVIQRGMSNNDLVNMLRSGMQQPVKVTFNNLRTLSDIAENLAKQLEPSAKELYKVFKNDSIITAHGFNKHTFKCIFIPNTYEMYWTTTPERLVKKMVNEYENFWNNKRSQKAKDIGLSREEVIILAAIVNQETRKNDEKAIIAGLYMNRLKRGIKLDADPTLIYASGDFNIRRVLNKHKQIDSPYNTYKNRGLPPGPICTPDISSIDAVLNYEKHKYLYFCLKADFSGYHAFAETYNEHLKNARAYHKELNRRRIYR